jgi:hypothetical protein
VSTTQTILDFAAAPHSLPHAVRAAAAHLLSDTLAVGAAVPKRPIAIVPYQLDSSDMKMWIESGNDARAMAGLCEGLFRPALSRRRGGESRHDVAEAASADHRETGAHLGIRRIPATPTSARRRLDRNAARDCATSGKGGSSVRASWKYSSPLAATETRLCSLLRGRSWTGGKCVASRLVWQQAAEPSPFSPTTGEKI